MTYLDDCIAAAVKAGTMSAKGAAEYATRMADAERLADQRGLAGAAKYEFAATEVAKNMEKRATNTRATVQMSILAVDRAWEGAKANTKGVGYGLTQTFGEHVAGTKGGPGIVQQTNGNVKTMQAIMGDFLANIQSKAFGLRQNRVLPHHTVSALYGRDVGNPLATASAKAWDEAMNWWRSSMAAAGVVVKRLEDWRLPQHFDIGAVRGIGKDGFRAQMLAWWDQGKLRIRDWEADAEAYFAPGLPDGENRVREIINGAYENIVSHGDASLEPGIVKGASLAQKYGRRRAFEWATDEAWLEFNDKFGMGNSQIGELMIRHINYISRDLGVAQVLGPDPDRAARTLIDMYRKEYKPGFLGRFVNWPNKLNAIYEVASGKASVPVSMELAQAGQAVRSGLSAVQLGGAILSAPSDLAFTRAVASWHGLSMTKIMGEYISRLSPRSLEDRVEAMRSISIVEVGLRGMGDPARDAIGDVIGRSTADGKASGVLNGLSHVGGRMAEFVIRAQGLSHHTQALRDAIGAQMQAHLSDLAPKSWADLSPVDRRTFETYGMGEKDWDLLRTKAVHKGIMDPTQMARDTKGAERLAAVKMLGAIAAIQRIAVPEGNVITRALMMGGTQPGSLSGEMLRSFAQYKGFPVASFLMHYFKAIEPLHSGENGWMRGTYIASLIVGATVLGAASLQLKNIAYGKDPEPMAGDNAAKFWALAFAQGGAGGIFGDQMKALVMASQQGDPSRMLNPTAGLLADTANLFRGNLGERLAGEDPRFGRDAVRFANKYTPDIFYTRLAMDRLVWDTLQKMVDPEAAGAFFRMEERARREQSTQYWSRPGSFMDARLPNMGNAVGAR